MITTSDLHEYATCVRRAVAGDLQAAANYARLAQLGVGDAAMWRQREAESRASAAEHEARLAGRLQGTTPPDRWLACDAPECDGRLPVVSTPERARAGARHAGWSSSRSTHERHVTDLCPIHTAELQKLLAAAT